MNKGDIVKLPHKPGFFQVVGHSIQDNIQLAHDNGMHCGFYYKTTCVPIKLYPPPYTSNWRQDVGKWGGM